MHWSGISAVDDNSQLVNVWNEAQTRFDDPSIRPQQKAWIALTRPLGLVEDTALLAAPNDFAKDYLENRLRPFLASVLGELLGRDINVAVTVQSQDAAAAAGADSGADAARAVDTPELRPIDADPAGEGWADGWAADDMGPGALGAGPANGYRARHSGDFGDRNTRLNPKYTFDTFVIGSSNRFTHAAAVAVAEAPARAYNPLFIYGDSGLGKTHLLHAIGHYARRLAPGLRTRYVSSEEFTNDFINSVRDDKMQAFQNRYRSVDVLLIDDIQFLERAERTQEEFFHTFNTLHNANKQIVISSDKSPRQLHSLEDRLRTRFEWGLISDVQAPDLETRIAILRKKAAQEGTNPPPEVLEFIASKIQSNIRELEGALIRVTAFANLNRHAVDLGLAASVLRDLVSEADALAISATTIMAVTAEYFSISMDDLVGASRSRVIANARQMAMYLCRELTDLSLPKIGEKFGNRDHTTVLHAEKKIRAQMAERLAVYNQISELTSRIRARART
jgi:chromosomal replication initiator protein